LSGKALTQLVEKVGDIKYYVYKDGTVHVYERYRGAVWVHLERPSEDGGCMS